MHIKFLPAQVFGDFKLESAEISDGRTLIDLTQDGEPSPPDRITGLEDLQRLFPYPGSSMTLLDQEELAELVKRLSVFRTA